MSVTDRFRTGAGYRATMQWRLKHRWRCGTGLPLVIWSAVLCTPSASSNEWVYAGTPLSEAATRARVGIVNPGGQQTPRRERSCRRWPAFASGIVTAWPRLQARSAQPL